MIPNTISYDTVSLWYGEVIALNEVSFEFEPGITGLVGSNGAGKTSAMKLAASLLQPTIGTVKINGELIWKNREYLSRLGFVPEVDRQFDWLTGRDFLKWNGKFHNIHGNNLRKRVQEILETIGMSHAADREISGYSRGMRQRIKVGSALVHEPEVLLVDEPMSGTDPIGRGIIVDVLRDYAKQGATIVVSSHVLHELERLSEEIILLESGKLVAEGRVSEVRKALSRIPQKVKITTNQPKVLAKELTNHVNGIQINEESIIVQVKNRSEFINYLSNLTENSNLQVYEVDPMDEDLSSLYSLIRNRKSQS